MEMKRLGLANKPMIIGLKANVHEIARTFKTAYPNAKILYPGKEDFTPKNRTKIFNEIKNNNWDAVILTHDQFGMIVQKEGLFMRENRFFVEDEGNIKYSYNNGHIANDSVLASQNFLKALEKMPSLIEHHEAKAETLARDIPALQEVVKATWRKEDELKELKTELAALSRKIELSLKPVDQSEEDKKVEKQEDRQKISVPQEKKEQTEEEKAIREIQALFTGKISPSDIAGKNDNNNSRQFFPIPEWLKEYKDTMGERLVIGSIPKHENQSKGFKL
jgi:hypothetical protein